MAADFPDPFSDAVVERMIKIIEEGDVLDLTVALDAQINSQLIPEWYQTNSISRIYSILLELRTNTTDRITHEKVSAMINHMKRKYRERIIVE